MKRSLVLLLVALLLASLGAVVLAEIPAGSGYEPGIPAGARARLDAYLAAVYPSGSVQVRAAARAADARHFDPEMSGPVFGDSAYYQTDLGPARTGRDSLLPLPYPPRELWCVLLEDLSAPPGTGGTVVFPALHMDMYNADWLVHEAAPGQIPGQTLAAVGCELPLE